MSKLSWKALGLAALVAGSLQMATMGGAVATTLPVPASPSVDTASQWDGQLQQAYSKKKYHSGKKYHSKKKYHSGKKHYDRKKYGHWRYDSHRHGHRYLQRRSGYGYYYGGYWYRRPWWTLTVPVPVVPYSGGSAHVRWCLNHYRSYNPRTDMFLGYDGYHHRCRSPY